MKSSRHVLGLAKLAVPLCLIAQVELIGIHLRLPIFNNVQANLLGVQFECSLATKCTDVVQRHTCS